MSEKLTPAMQQFYEIKKEYSDCIIFFRMGDFYEMFGDDAHIGHKVLGINITSRNKNAKNSEALAGIPYHAKEKYLPLLVKAGYKVAIVEQVSDPTLKGIVKREVARVVTPATLGLEGDNFDNMVDNTTILSIVEDDGVYGLSVIDLSTGKWQTAQFISFDELAKKIYILSPGEVVLDKKLFSNQQIKDILEKKYSLNIYFYEFRGKYYEKLVNHFKTKNLIGFGIEDKKSCQFASSLLLDYIESNQKESLTHIDTISYINDSKYLEIDDSTLKSLDIVFNYSTQSQNVGTLFGVLNQTKTPMGKRYLRNALLKPLYSKEDILNRQEFIQEFYNNKILLAETREKLGFISDLDAILNRLVMQRITPKDLINLKNSLKSILEIYDLIENKGSDKLKKLINNK